METETKCPACGVELRVVVLAPGEGAKRRWEGSNAEERRAHALKMVEARRGKAEEAAAEPEKAKVAPILAPEKKTSPKPVSVAAKGQFGCVRHRMYEPDCEYCRLNRG